MIQTNHIPLLLIITTLLLSLSSGEQLFLRTCAGDYFLFPNAETAITINAKQLGAMQKFQTDFLFNSFSCDCPSATIGDYLKVYGAVGGIADTFFNSISENPMKGIEGCMTDDMDHSESVDLNFVLPDSCNWEKEGKCLAKAELVDGAVFDIAMQRCENSYEPFISVGCTGDACASLGLPCTSDDQCGGSLTCNRASRGYIDIFDSEMDTRFFMIDLFLAEWDFGGESNCSSPLTLLRKAANYLRTAVYGMDEITFSDHIGFCSPAPFELDSNELPVYLLNQTNLQKCDVTPILEFTCRANQKIVNDPSECPDAYQCDKLELNTTTGEYECTEYECAESVSNSTTGETVCLRLRCQKEEYFFNETTGTTDFRCIHYSDVTTYISKIDCVADNGPLKSWDGMTADGTNIFNLETDHPYEIPATFARTPRTENAIVILETTCTENLRFMPGTKLSMSLKAENIINTYNMVYDLYRERADCEAKAVSEELDDTKFGANHFLLSYLSLFTNSKDNWLDQTLTFRTPAQDAFNQSGFSSFQQYKTPSTCDYNSWKNDGTCDFTYDGLSELVSLDIKFNVAIGKCSFREFPSIYVECEGDDCNMLQGLISCDPSNPDADCPRGECLSYDSFLDQLGYITNDTCSQKDYLTTTFKAALSYFEESPKSGICMPSFSRISSIGMSWAQRQVYTDGDAVAFTSVSAWNSPEAVDESVDGTSEGIPTVTEDNSEAFLIVALNSILLLGLFFLA